jgi:curved DNA-binding protein CbpA
VAQTIASHYDNLKVGRDAPVGVIKASYRKLSQKYHPDRNPDPAALEIMKLINLAWDVLSDPERRARHDRAIAALERRVAVRPAARAPAPVRSDALRVVFVLAVFLALLLLTAFLAAGSGSDEDDVQAEVPAALEHEASPAAQTERVPHGYLAAVAQDQSPGIAVVDIDNTAGVRDAEVRLFVNGRAARSMNVHHGKRFVVENLAPGKYVLKYRMEVDGKTLAYQERAVFQPRRDLFSKLKVRLPDAAGNTATADAIAADRF